MAKAFIYDPGSVTTDTLRIMRRKAYDVSALTTDEADFWTAVDAACTAHATLAILSHGNEEGFLGIAGNEGPNIDLSRFAAMVSAAGMPLYLLSCRTGKGPCATALQSAELSFVAPAGVAVFQTIGSETINVKSQDKDGSYPGWAGPLAPERASSAVSLP